MSATERETTVQEGPRLEVGASATIDVVRWARGVLARGGVAFGLDVPDPDRTGGAWPGAADADGIPSRSWRAWLDLADELGCAVSTPARLEDGTVRITFRALGPEAPWHAPATGPREERYAASDAFGAVRKLQHPGVLLPLLEALGRTRPPDGGRVLMLGCHRGDEIEALGMLEGAPRDLDVVGVDHAETPLREAAARFPAARFVRTDLNALPGDLGAFDLVVAIGVLQSPSVDDRALLARLVAHHLTAHGALLLGVPNSRFRGGDVTLGARTRNYAERDLSLVVKDLAAYRRYLHQHGFRTHIGGRYDLLLSATRRDAARAERPTPAPGRDSSP